MSKKNGSEEAFQEVLDGKATSASPEVEQLAKLAAVLTPSRLEGPSPQFRTRLRNELLAQASMSEEDVFAAAMDGITLDTPEEVKPLVAVASSLALHDLPAPSPAFRYQLRNRLMMEAQRAAEPTGARARQWVADLNTRLRRSFRVVGVAAVLSISLLGSSIVLAASQGALPGGTLYGVKRLHESAQLLRLSGEAEGRALLGFARTRMQEIRSLSDRGVTDETLYIDTLADMDRLTTEGSRLLLQLFEATGLTEPIEFLAAFARVQSQDLASVIDRLPPGARPSARGSLEHLGAVLRQTERTLSGCDCPIDPMLDASLPSGAAVQQDIRCVCQPEAPSTGSEGSSGGSGSSNADGSNGGGTRDPKDPDQPTQEDPTVDLPGELPDNIEDSGEGTIDDIVDIIEDLPTDLPSPLPSPPDAGDVLP
jgi:hypothetical protein